MEMERIIETARAYRRAAGWTRTRLARECGFKSDNSLRGLDDRNWNPTRRTLERLAEFIGDWRPGDPVYEDEAV